VRVNNRFLLKPPVLLPSYPNFLTSYPLSFTAP
jgi:hypothetical protein